MFSFAVAGGLYCRNLRDGADGASEIEGKTARVAASEWSRWDASDIDGQTERSKWAGAHESIGKRASFKSANLRIKLEMAEHSGFEKLVAEAKKHITEISPQDAAAKLNNGDAIVVDVRDRDEWDGGHIPGATHMSRGTIELDIEEKVPDPNAMIICHCGGGGRSALAAETLQKMGYKNVHSMAGGLKALKTAGLPTTT